MFTNKSKIESYGYQVNLGVPVNFFCKLINDIGSNIIDDYNIATLFKDELISEIGFRFDEDSMLSDLTSYISDYYATVFLENIDISKSNILFIYKLDRIIFCYGNDVRAIKTSLNNLLLEEKIFEKLISHVNDNKLRISLEKLQSITFSELFYNVIQVGDKKDIPAPYVPIGYFEENLIIEEIIDEQDLKFNKEKLKKETGITIKDDSNISLIKVELQNEDLLSIAIRCDGFVFPITSRDLRIYIGKEFETEYCWLLFKEVFRGHHDRNRKNSIDSELLINFKENIIKSDLSQLLSYLEQNHRININHLNKYSKYEKYFEKVSKIKNLAEITNYEFYVSNVKGSTALGVFCKEKIGTNYNLLHWVKNNGDENSLDYYKNIDPPKIQVDEKAYVFKPEIAFYYMTNYFEDFLEGVLKAAKKEYIDNFRLYTGDQVFAEIDFLVKSENKLCFIEAKTKLSNEYIEQTIHKCEKLLIKLGIMNINCNIEFFLISAFSDPSCENKQYFINESKKKRYNKPRNGINTIPYYFDVPIPKYKNSKLTCIAEPDFKKLTALLAKI